MRQGLTVTVTDNNVVLTCQTFSIFEVTNQQYALFGVNAMTAA